MWLTSEGNFAAISAAVAGTSFAKALTSLAGGGHGVGRGRNDGGTDAHGKSTRRTHRERRVAAAPVPVASLLSLLSIIKRCSPNEHERRLPHARVALRYEQGTPVVAGRTGSVGPPSRGLAGPSSSVRRTVRTSCVRVARWANQPHSCSRCKSGPRHPWRRRFSCF